MNNMQVFEDIKKVFIDLGMPISNEELHEKCPNFWSAFSDDPFYSDIFVIYYKEDQLVRVIALYWSIPEERMSAALELINQFNENTGATYFCIMSVDNELSIQGGIHVTGSSLNKEHFKSLLMEIIENIYQYFPVIVDKLEPPSDSEAVPE